MRIPLLLLTLLLLTACGEVITDNTGTDGTTDSGQNGSGSDTGGGDTGGGGTGGGGTGGGGTMIERFVSPDGNDTLGDGSEASPWRTLQFAVDNLQPGERLRVLPGVYAETLIIGSEDSGSEAQPIEIIGAPGAIIDGSGITPQDRQALIELRSASWVRLQNLELRNFRTQSGYEVPDTPIGLLISGGSSDIEVRGLDIHHIENRSTCALDDGCGVGANGIAVYGDSATPIRNLRFVDNRVHDNTLASSESFTLNGNIDGFELIGNEVRDNNNIAFDFIGYEADVCPTCDVEDNRARNGIVRGNRAIDNSSLGNPAYGNATEGSAGGFYVDGGHHILFENNISMGNDIGLEIASEHAGKASEYIVVRNSLIHDNLQAGLSLGGYASSDQGEGGGSARNLWIYNNTLYHNRGWGSEITLAYRVQDAVFANNVLYGTGTPAENLDSQSNGGYSGLQWLKNLWWGEDSGGDDLPNADQLRADPGLVDPPTGDFSLTAGSPAVDAGVSPPAPGVWPGEFWNSRYPGGLPALADTDAAGDPREQGTAVDLGALERQP